MRQSPPHGLRSNVLLTRYPICLVHGLKSIFHFRDYWHGIPEYLAAHGFEVFEFSANWRGPHDIRLAQFSKQLEGTLVSHDKVHLVAHSLGCLDTVDLLSWPNFRDRLSSVTFVSPPFDGSPWALLGTWGKWAGLNLFSSTNDTLTPNAAGRILEKFDPPENILMGSILTRPQGYPLTPKLFIQHALLTRYLTSRKHNPENDGLVSLESQRIAKKFGPVFQEFPGDHMQVTGAGPWPQGVKTAHEMFLDHCIFLAEHDLKTAELG